MARRFRQPPSTTRAAKNSLDSALHPHIDAALKQLKSCARTLQPVLSTFSDELQILHQLYYKGKNQHRSALFWRRVTEMRRYGDRVEELSLSTLVDSLRYSFFGEDLQQTTKLLKGSWTHYPDSQYVSFVLKRFAASIGLVQKVTTDDIFKETVRNSHLESQMQERFARAYQSFSLAMQTGAFIQLILTLTGITSRMSTLVSELLPVLELIQDAVRGILVTLDPGSVTRSFSLRRTSRDQSSVMLASGGSIDVDEDYGVSITARPDLQPEITPNPYINTAHEDVLHLPKADNSSSVVVHRRVVTKKVKRPEPESDAKQSKPAKRAKVKRDEIDDIFG